MSLLEEKSIIKLIDFKAHLIGILAHLDVISADIPVVLEFIYVFKYFLRLLLPDRIVEFIIYLISCAVPISQALY